MPCPRKVLAAMNPAELQRLKDLDRRLVWHPFTQMQEYMAEEPLIIERGEGCFLVDVEGRRYLDGVSSLWVNVHGHRRAELDAAVRAQLDKLAHSTLLGLASIPSIELAERLLNIAPPNLKKVFYSDSGATAVEIALKMAFQYWQQQGGADAKKIRFVTLRDAYHGDTLGSVSVGGIDLFHRVFRPLLFESLVIENFSFEQATEIFQRHSGEIAACVVEPMIQGAAGMRTQPPGFLTHLRKLCDAHGAFLICDEVATGFGRTGKMFAVEHEGVAPDFLCLAKGITGGYLPLAATLTTQRVFDGFCGAYRDFKTFFHGHSYTGNPLACAAALANLAIFEQEKVIAALQPKVELFREALRRFAAHPHVAEVRQIGLMAGIELSADRAAQRPYPLEAKMGFRVCRAARARGALLRPLGNVLVVLPPLAIEARDLQALLDILWDSLVEVTQGDADRNG
ncbi:MAG: adenosylmethionine--8-amino-7-oxononanoate transaminase [bacterium]